VPHYAMSGGTLISMAADEIVMDVHAALGPVDPQLGQYAAASILAALEAPGDHDDETLILGDVSRKAMRQVEVLARRLLSRGMSPDRAADVAFATVLSGRAELIDDGIFSRASARMIGRSK